MRAFFAFGKKEILEYIRTYKLLVVSTVFLLLGLLNPVTAKLMPSILGSVMPEGLTLSLPEPGAIDSWTQFYKNMTGIQLILFIILFSGSLPNELSGGTLINLLTKGLARPTVLWAKLASITAVWSLCYLLAFGATYGYTLYLLPGELSNVGLAAFGMWLFGILLIAVMLLGGVLFANVYGSLLLTGGFVALMMLANFVPGLRACNPYRLASDNVSLLTGAAAASELTVPIMVSCALSGVSMAGALTAFRAKRL